ncbi:glutathione peroxidase [Sulfitobacter guttiformis]|uniref:Glutathione peroxidase n=1 Tax=Sulfitobacter guttiformis TaxID=74349 RepID=A0A420DS12_9RHOB|nr:glutathione peroxidase [Sulfitobacter guttiformis]KIN74330.1 Glutathione peroxidase [Sulfitobacter guttiformis KCTC 32187]RKE96927.1 glutathione peroxidase [Sulfitobacter guttiformis]
MRMILGLILSIFAGSAIAAPQDAVFPSIDGGTIALRDYAGQPVLVVNTASQCGFTYQYDGLQALYDRFRDQGLIVLAIPSDDFNQELGSAAEVKEFCEVNFGLTLPMTDMMHVRGASAHPFYKAVKAETGFEPSWNFNKILIDGHGAVVGTWGSSARPDSGDIPRQIELLLN